MTPHATPMTEHLLPCIEHTGMFEDQITGVTLLTTRLNVVFSKQRPQPKLVPPVSLSNGGRCHAIPIVAGRAAKSFRVVNLQKLFGGMAGKDLFTDILLGNGNWLTDAEVTGLTAVHQVHLLDVDLFDLDLEILRLANQARDLLFGDPCE